VQAGVPDLRVLFELRGLLLGLPPNPGGYFGHKTHLFNGLLLGDACKILNSNGLWLKYFLSITWSIIWFRMFRRFSIFSSISSIADGMKLNFNADLAVG
jgi:hypothetical protein